jgi:hypothetical protein
MPVKSKAQSRFLNWKFGHKWVKKHHFAGKTGDLPEKKPEDKKEKRKEEMTTSVNVGGGPASVPAKKKSNSKIPPQFLKHVKKKKGEGEKEKNEAALQRVMNMVYQEEARLRKK